MDHEISVSKCAAGAEIRTELHPDASVERYRCTNLLGDGNVTCAAYSFADLCHMIDHSESSRFRGVTIDGVWIDEWIY
jgi:hypothetical protein